MLRSLLLAGALTLAFCLPAEAALFGVPDRLRSTGLASFTKWTDMLRRRPDDSGPRARLSGSGSCVPNPRFACPSAATRASLPDQLRQASRIEQLRQVNAQLNDIPYVTDPINWGLDDYWSTLAQFLRRDGDCEDYAIAKYMTLKALGVPVADMKLVIVMDQNLNVPHAILAVRSSGQTYILDNQLRDIVPDTSIRHYKPFYAINEEAWWVFLAQP